MPRGDLQVTTRELPARLADQALMLEFVAFLPCDPRDKELKDQRKRQANSAGSLCEVSRVRAAWPLHVLCSGGSKGGMKVGGVKEMSPNIVESTIGTLEPT